MLFIFVDISGLIIPDDTNAPNFTPRFLCQLIPRKKYRSFPLFSSCTSPILLLYYMQFKNFPKSTPIGVFRVIRAVFLELIAT